MIEDRIVENMANRLADLSSQLLSDANYASLQFSEGNSRSALRFISVRRSVRMFVQFTNRSAIFGLFGVCGIPTSTMSKDIFLALLNTPEDRMFLAEELLRRTGFIDSESSCPIIFAAQHTEAENGSDVSG